MYRVAFRLVRAAVVFALVAALVRRAVKTPMMAGWERQARAKWTTTVKPRMGGGSNDGNTGE